MQNNSCIRKPQVSIHTYMFYLFGVLHNKNYINYFQITNILVVGGGGVRTPWILPLDPPAPCI